LRAVQFHRACLAKKKKKKKKQKKKKTKKKKKKKKKTKKKKKKQKKKKKKNIPSYDAPLPLIETVREDLCFKRQGFPESARLCIPCSSAQFWGKKNVKGSGNGGQKTCSPTKGPDIRSGESWEAEAGSTFGGQEGLWGDAQKGKGPPLPAKTR